VRNGTTWTQQAYLKASNTGAGDYFGFSVSISGDTIVVGARWEDSNATGVNGDQNNNGATNSGAAYVFVRNGTSWTQQAYLKASNTQANDSFGEKVYISGDTIVVGALGEDSNATEVNGDQNNDGAIDSGAVYVFARHGTTWIQVAYLKVRSVESPAQFGYALAVDKYIVAGQLHDNAAMVFSIEETGTSITETSTTTVSTVEDESNDNSTVIIIAVAVSLVVLSIVSAVIGLVLFRRKRKNNGHSAHTSVSLTLPSKSHLKNIKVEELLGSGNFGEFILFNEQRLIE
jgi:hypothetical protein